MPNLFKVIPTTERPARAIPANVERSRVSGDYQAVISLTGKPNKAELFLMLAEASRSLADLAEKWASEEGLMVDEQDLAEEQVYRIYYQMTVKPEGGVDHAQVSSFAPAFRGL